MESDVEVEVPDGYLHFGVGGAIINDLDGEEPQQRQQGQQSMINPNDTELARASEAIYIYGNSSNSGGSGGASQQQRQQHASNATPPATSGPAVHNENSEGEGSEADVMITSEVEDHRLRLLNTRPQREIVNDSSEDDDDEAVDPGARATRGMYRRGQTHIDGEEDDEDEEDEVHADVASV